VAKRTAGRQLQELLLRYALELPEAYEDHPWGDTVVKVRKKIFTFLGEGHEGLARMTVKLTDSHAHAMSLPGAVPTGYGLGRAGWVTLPLAADLAPPDLLCDWLEESYRLVAPKRLAALLDADRSA
jgi:predicted DNA-binding protein (MmcQ/YjbR family)